MFIVCFDENLKKKLKSNGFKLLNQDNDKATFVFDNTIKFNFDSVDKSKYILTNKLTF